MVETLPSLYDETGFDGLTATDFSIVTIDNPGNDDIVNTRGLPVEYRRSVTCPCLRSESGRARRGCLMCNGHGYVYPVELRQRIRVIASNHMANSKQIAAGEALTGRVSATFPSAIIPQVGDMVLPEGQFHVVDETIIHAQMPTSHAALAALRENDLETLPVLTAAEDILRYPVVESILGIWGWDPTAAQRTLAGFNRKRKSQLTVEELQKLQNAGLPFYPPSSYTLEGNVIVWKDRAPAPGTVITVKYHAPAAYFIAEPPPFRADASTRLNVKVSMIRWDALGQNNDQD